MALVAQQYQYKVSYKIAVQCRKFEFKLHMKAEIQTYRRSLTSGEVILKLCEQKLTSVIYINNSHAPLLQKSECRLQDDGNQKGLVVFCFKFSVLRVDQHFNVSKIPK
jgi:hypothetical protein